MSKIQTNPQQTKSKAQDIGLIELKIRSLQLGSKNIPSNFLVCANIFIGWWIGIKLAEFKISFSACSKFFAISCNEADWAAAFK